MKKITAFFIFFLGMFSISPGQHWDWTRLIGKRSFFTQADPSGNCFIGGKITDTIRIDNYYVQRSPDSLVFLAKIDTRGHCSWLKKIKATAINSFNIDANDNLFITVDTLPEMQYNDERTSNSLIKYDSLGTELWTRQLVVTPDNQYHHFCFIYYIEPMDNGKVLLKGDFVGNLRLGSLTLSDSTWHTFFAECSSSGNFVWLKMESWNLSGVHNTCIYRDKIFCLEQDTLVALDTAGNWLNAINVISRPNSPSYSYGWCEYFLDNDSAGNLYVAQTFERTVQIGTYAFTDVAYPPSCQYCSWQGDIYLFKMRPTGSILWAERFFSRYSDFLSGMSVSAQGNIVLSGTNGDIFYVNSDTLDLRENSLFLLLFDANGNTKMLTGIYNIMGGVYYGSSLTLSDKSIFISGITTNDGIYVLGNDTISKGACFLSKITPDMIAGLSITDVPGESLVLSPVPGRDLVTLHYSSATTIGAYSIYILNEQGQLMYREDSYEASNSLIKGMNVRPFPKGIYFLELVTGERKAVQKIVTE